jgi:ribosomal protein S12 methylthiotransferase accessory factor
LVDDHTGVISYVSEVPKDAGDPDFFHFYAHAANTRAFRLQKNFADTGGASCDRGAALAKAIGEAVERYCAAIYEAEEFPLLSQDEAPFRCVPPEEFALYSSAQYSKPHFPYQPFTSKARVRWMPAINLKTKETWYVPAGMIVIPYFYAKERGEAPVVQPISTGLACHCTIAEAALSAICEVVERDAFMIMWQASLGMPHVIKETLTSKNRDLVDRFEKTESIVTIFNITMDHGVPTILSVLKGKDRDTPALVFAAAADLDPEQAVKKSLEELAHTRRHAKHLKASMPAVPLDLHFEKVMNQASHVRLYCDHSNAHLADFVFSSQEHIDFKEIPNASTGNPDQDLTVLVSKINASGHQVLVNDLTSEDIVQLGLRVVRAIIPGFHPLFMGHSLRALGGKRLWELPYKLGYRSDTFVSSDNHAPHPYP